ncbi:MAG TPA: peptidylprolyl isomerase [Candidatus Binataceae bacterium]|nr:peptidylprolyl isomerase [Candidatus Binataceae bacterium]
MIAKTILTRRSCRITCLILTIAAALASASTLLAQAIPNNLTWQQRFIGIIPLVKPDPKDPIVVTVNGVPITVTQVSEYAQAESKMLDTPVSEESRAVWKDAEENLINRELLLQEAEKEKVSIPDAEVAQRAREFNISGGSAATGGSSAPDEQLLKAVRGSMEIEKMLDGEFRKHDVEPTAKQIKDYYDEHPELFMKDPGKVKISHIAVKFPAHPTDADRDAAEKKIMKLYAEAKKTKDFAALAKKSSEDAASGPGGGLLGEFRPGQLPPVVDKLVFDAPVGSLTPVIQSELGYSFIKIDARSGGIKMDFPEAKAKIALFLLGYNQDQVVKAEIRKLAKSAKIEFKTPPNQEMEDSPG